MTNPSDNLNARLKGLGITMSASPPLVELREEAVALFDSGASEDDVRDFLAAFFVDHDDIGLRAFLGLNRAAMRLPADKGLMAVAKHWAAKLKKRTVHDLLTDWTRRNNVDLWLSDFIVEWAQTGEPPAMAGRAARVVGDLPMGKDSEPLVFMFAGALCDPDEACEEFKKKCAQVFPPETWMRKGFSERDARRVKAFAEGATDFDIAKSELDAEGWRTRAASKKEYNAEVRTRANSVLVSRNRWYEYVTGLLDSESPRND